MSNAKWCCATSSSHLHDLEATIDGSLHRRRALLLLGSAKHRARAVLLEGVQHLLEGPAEVAGREINREANGELGVASITFGGGVEAYVLGRLGVRVVGHGVGRAATAEGGGDAREHWRISWRAEKDDATSVPHHRSP